MKKIKPPKSQCQGKNLKKKLLLSLISLQLLNKMLITAALRSFSNQKRILRKFMILFKDLFLGVSSWRLIQRFAFKIMNHSWEGTIMRKTKKKIWSALLMKFKEKGRNFITGQEEFQLWKQATFYKILNYDYSYCW